MVDGIITNYVDINRGLPQGTVLGPITKPINKNNELLKFADDMTLEVPGINGSDTSNMEVNNIVKWSELNRMPSSMNKTWEMVIQGNGNGSIPIPIHRLNGKPGWKFWAQYFKKIHVTGTCTFIN